MNAGRRVSLAEIIKIKHGFAFKGEDITTEQQPHFLVTPGNFSIGGGFKLNRLKYFKGIPPEEYVLRPGDLVVTMTDLSKNMDTLGYAATVPSLPPGLTALHNQRIGLISITSPDVDQNWLEYRMRASDYRAEVLASSSGSTVHHTSPGRILEFQLDLPSLEDQRAVASVLSTLDEKIESNRRQRGLLRDLGSAYFFRSVNEVETRTSKLAACVLSIARGVSPKYADSDPGAPLVLNQRCIRDGWASIAQARRMVDRAVKPEKRATKGDLLVNSTGVGTLGRVARWNGEDVYVDSHVSVVRPDTAVVPPVVLAYALLGREADIERLGIGSTGQTELSPSRLGELQVALPAEALCAKLETLLLAIEDRAEQLASETMRLESLRDALLPELLSGRISPTELEGQPG